MHKGINLSARPGWVAHELQEALEVNDFQFNFENGNELNFLMTSQLDVRERSMATFEQ